MNKKYIVRLSDEERHQLTELTRKGKAVAYKIRHAHILLKADADGPAWTDAKIVESFSVSVKTVLGGLGGPFLLRKLSRWGRLSPYVFGRKKDASRNNGSSSCLWLSGLCMGSPPDLQ